MRQLAAHDQRRADFTFCNRLGQGVDEKLRHVAAARRVNMPLGIDTQSIRDALGRVRRSAELGREAGRALREQPHHGHCIDRLRQVRGARVGQREPAGIGDQIERRSGGLRRYGSLGQISATHQDRRRIFDHRSFPPYAAIAPLALRTWVLRTARFFR